jgi:hemerythrin
VAVSPLPEPLARRAGAPAAARPKIFAISDDPTILVFLRAKVSDAYALKVVSGADDVEAAAGAESPDLILCDLSLPSLDGYGICRRLKANGATRDVPVVFVTPRPLEAADEQRGIEAGGVDYLSKTLDRDAIGARLRLHIALRDAQQELRRQNAMLEARVAERTAEVEASREALREAMHNLRTTRVSAGVYWVQVPEAGLYILCGCPGDVVKHLMLKGYIAEERRGGVQSETGPNVILLSDVPIQNGSFANLAEFPVLQMLYRQGMILPGHPNNTGRKPLVIGSEAQVRAQLDYIYRGNYGLVSEEEVKAAGVDEQEAKRHMALKLRFAFGSIRSSEDLLDFRVLGCQPVELGNGVSARRTALGRFEFAYRGKTTEVDLNLGPHEPYESPYTPGQHLIEAQYFGVIHCGEGDGWDLRRQSMGSIVMFQGRYYLVDAGPSVLHTLRGLGIDVSEIEGIFHTHSHDDHFAGLPALLFAGRRIKYFATPLVRHSVTKKLAALMSIEEHVFENLFEVHDLMLDQWNDCDGLEVMPLDSPHPVETTIFLFRVRDEDRYKSYAHWADIVSMEVLERLVSASPAKELLGPDFAEQVRTRYLTTATLKKIDCGGGLIHGSPLDFRDDLSDKIVLAHRATPFSAEELEVGSQAIFGAVDPLVTTSQDYLRQHAHRYLSELFTDASMEALNVLLRSPIASFNAGHLIARSGSRPRHAFLVLGGSVELSFPQDATTLALPAGSLLGAELLYSEEGLETSWRATSPVRALRIGIETLRAFLLNGGWHGMLRSLLEDTALLRGTVLFGERIALPVLARIARAARRVPLEAGQSLQESGATALYLVSRGSLELRGRPDRVLETLASGDFFGEETCLGRPAPEWFACAREASELLAFDPDELRRIPVVLWKALEVHERRLCSLEIERLKAPGT